MSTFRDLVTALGKDTKMDLERLQEAYEFAKKAHEGQFRQSGLPYITHPLETALFLSELKVDEDTLIAGLLHDVPEDTPYSVEDIREHFGKHVADLVDALTKLSKVHYRYSMSERQVHSLRKMFLETARDFRVVIIKLCDRLHNMSTLQFLRPEKQQRIAKETLEIYVPLASLFGMYQLRQSLEDLCFKYLQPEDYERIESFVHDQEKDRKHYVERTIRQLKKATSGFKGPLEFQGRPKSYYSIYQKCLREQKRLQEVYDYFAIRIIAQSIEECYLILGKVHEVFKPKPGRLKDYIALPKPNGYQSLHTTVIGLEGRPTEIQIRTQTMHEEAEYGIAAHHLYKESQNSLIQALLAEIKDFKDSNQFVQQLQLDFLQDRIFVFSPSGETLHLPEGATCLDYMYAVGLPVEGRVFKVLVNQKPYSIVGELQSGDQVEVIYGTEKRGKGPERWWLPHLKTALARNQLRRYFKRKSREEKLQLGSKLLQQELDHENMGSLYHLPGGILKRTLEHFQVKNLEELLIQIGEGSLECSTVYDVMYPKLPMVTMLSPFKRLLRALFRKDPNLADKYRIRIRIDAHDRMGLLQEILKPFYKLKIPIVYLSAKGHDTPTGFRLLTLNPTPYERDNGSGPPKYLGITCIDVLVANHEQLTRIFDEMQKIAGVISVRRVFKTRLALFTILSLLTVMYWAFHPLLVSLVVQNPRIPNVWINVSTYLALIGFLALALWLRSMGNRTFPHFEETRWFWPLTFGIAILVIATLFIEDALLHLDLERSFMILFSIVIFGIVLFSYFSQRSRKRDYYKSRSPRVFDRATEKV